MTIGEWRSQQGTIKLEILLQKVGGNITLFILFFRNRFKSPCQNNHLFPYKSQKPTYPDNHPEQVEKAPLD